MLVLPGFFVLWLNFFLFYYVNGFDCGLLGWLFAILGGGLGGIYAGVLKSL